ncbi:NADH-ubiquinone oxidoreductase chain 5 [Armadillidium nasatum]|uniref:NADH:ubiquinone reductase (H(+)-translocating) n=1 Tax=Armadillidium nasatum TaxID=96803 RepID=A0A5N5T2V5_9CRUS|nr:NADH-ubiquinone oxidoreductase chain 5 [Armadillidium nasatum]KAB7500796.1 NADH-ubiquinone oxidoreductase chain 5 [Armadillidium nasatum]KAB7501202.1 NADH-ubiquinone oxidoreductase chain 5 [Armadillidium nasatum]
MWIEYRLYFLVFSLNLVRIMLGWDGLGIISYILVVFYNNDKSNSAGMLTVIRNRVLTTLIASLRALFEPDLKKVVALSTLSQLGIIIRTLALGFRELAFIHLLTHAVFKALLFICRGKIIHNVGGYQDTRKIGGEMFNLPVTRIIIVLSSYALCGVPFLAGFYSKDLIIEARLIGDIFFINYCLYILSVGLSTRYSFRLLFMSIVGPTNQSSYIRRDEED